MNFYRLALITMTIVLSTTNLSAQNEILHLHGQVRDRFTNKELENVTVQIFKDSVLIDNINVGSSGMYDVKLPLGFAYDIKFAMSDYLAKVIRMDTRNIPAGHSSGGLDVVMNGTLFPYREGFNTDILKEPMAKALYNSAAGGFDFDMNYSKRKQYEIDAEFQRLDGLVAGMEQQGSDISAQNVTEVSATQEGNTFRIHYTLETATPCDIRVHLSTDDGTTWSEALQHVTGDVGPGITSGRRNIVWDVFKEREKMVGNAQFKVVAISRKSFEPEMVFVEGGTFQMGSTSGDDDERPVHAVTLSSFYIGKYEVTQAQWRELMGSDASSFRNCDQCPVESVSWDDVQDYILKLNIRTGKQYRLPTEAEWEFAARGGNLSMGYTYSGSIDLKSVAWYDENAQSKTHPVGQKQANELGVYDMSGNVYEWCIDWYGSYVTNQASNPQGPSSGDYHVLRGGSWHLNAQRCRTTDRIGFVPEGKFSNRGFRLVLSLNSRGE
jgi:formylglycine-generating enzyme required for sulfatase activity